MSQLLPVMIRGTGAYVPAEVLTNQHFINYLDTSDEWIVTRTGIRERRRAAPNESTSTMAVEAARRALDNAGMTPDQIDIVICATATPDCHFPATASFIQAALGMGNKPGFDVEAACAGFIYAMTIGSAMLGAGMYARVLVIGAETLTRFANPQDRTTCILLGDAAGAAVLIRAENPGQGILHWRLGCDGTKAQYIWVPAGGSRMPASTMTVNEQLHYMHMRGREVFKFAVLKMEELIDEMIREAGIAPDELRFVIPHQSNLRIIDAVRERLGLPHEKIAVNIDRFGNTSAASILLSLDEARRTGQVRAGDLVMFIAIGAGLTWGVMLMRM